MTDISSVVKLLRKEHDHLTKQIKGIAAALEAFGAAYGKQNGTRKISAAGRARIAAAQKARWAKLETIVAHKSRLPRSGLCLRLLQSESLKHKRSAGRLGRRRKLRSLKQSHFLSRFHVDPLGIPQKSWQVMFSLRALCVSSAPSAFTGGLQLCASSVAGGRHTRSGMQNRESTVKAIYGEPVATHGKTSGVVGIRTLSHGANRNAEWCEQTRGGCSNDAPDNSKGFWGASVLSERDSMRRLPSTSVE